jgi:hypothetical protein
MAHILADAYNKAIDEEGEKMDKQPIETLDVNPTPSPNDDKTEASAEEKAVGASMAEV